MQSSSQTPKQNNKINSLLKYKHSSHLEQYSVNLSENLVQSVGTVRATRLPIVVDAGNAGNRQRKSNSF